METKLMITRVMKCEPKGQDPYVRLDYICMDETNMVTSNNVFGGVPGVSFFNDVVIFDKLKNVKNAILNKEVIATIEHTPNFQKPLEPKAKITSIKTSNGIINFL